MIKRALATGTALAASACLIATSAAHADVAYIDGNEVWVSTLDGSQKVRLSGGEGDWRDVAVSDQGYVVGVRLEASKVADLSSFTVWNPQGQRIKFGPLVGGLKGASNTHPLNLQLTPDGGLLVYGFQSAVYFPSYSLTSGFILLPSATASPPATNPFFSSAAQWPALVGERVVGATSRTVVGVQEAGSTGSSNFTGWLDVSGVGTNPRINGLDVNSAGTKVAINIDTDSWEDRLIVVPVPGLGQPPVEIAPGDVGDCFVPTTGDSWHPSISPDGARIAWSDGGGVKVAGIPVVVPTSGPCTMSSPVVTISATGKYPSLGPISVAALQPAPAPAPAPAQTPQTPPPAPGPLSGLTIDKLASKKGAAITVTSATAGKVTVRLTVKPKAVGLKGKKSIVVGQGSQNVAAGSASKVKVKLTAKGKKLRKKLKGKTVTVTITAGGQITTRTLKLR